MDIKGKNIGFALTGSFCTIEKAMPLVDKLVFLGANVTPILSETVANLDTRFTNAEDIKRRLEEGTGNDIISTIIEAEPIGPKKTLDIIVVAPCTGNTLARLASAAINNSVTMACKAHLRNGGPVLLGIATNDGLSGSAQNIAKLLNAKNIYFVPFAQDDPKMKPTSLVCKFERLIDSIEEALDGNQIQPIIEV